MNNLLLDRKMNIDGNWYAPIEFIETSYKSIVMAEYYNMSSSAGDWDGYFIQKIGDNYYLILFSQENNGINTNGFTLYTSSNPSYRYKYKPTKEEIYQDIDLYLSQYIINIDDGETIINISETLNNIYENMEK